MPGAIANPTGVGGGASNFSAIAGSPADNAALVAFVDAKVSEASGGGSGGVVDGGAPDSNYGGTSPIDGGTP